MTRAMTPEAERLLADYLDRVRGAMAAAGRDRSEVENVIDALREQAWEVSAQAGGSTISGAVMTAALGELDPPDNFGAAAPSSGAAVPSPGVSAPPEVSTPDGRRWLGWLSAAGGVATLILAVVAGAVSEEMGGSILILGFGVALLAGAMSWRTLPGRFGLGLSLIVLGGIGLLFLLGV